MVPHVSVADIGVVASAVLSVLAILGLAVRFVLMPYLREQVIRPVKETHRQITEHDPRSPSTTVRDQIDDLGTKVDDVLDRVEHLSAEATAAAVTARAAGRATSATTRRLDRHLAWASEEARRVWATISRYHPEDDPRHSAEDDRKEPPP